MSKNLLTFDEYIKRSAETAFYVDRNKHSMLELAYIGLGLGGEAGETVDTIKKAIRTGDPLTMHLPEVQGKIINELGDLLWYMARVMEFYNVTFEELAQGNLEKLSKRHKNDELVSRRYIVGYKNQDELIVAGPFMDILEALEEAGEVGQYILCISGANSSRRVLYKWNAALNKWVPTLEYLNANT